MITTATFAGASHLLVLIEPEGIVVPLDHEDLMTWVSDGNIINPYEFPIEQARESKILETVNYAEDLVSQAYSNPEQGVSGLDHKVYKAKIDVYRRHNIDLMSVGQALSGAETNQAVINETLSGYEMDILNDIEAVKVIITALSTSGQVMALDIRSQDWTLWVPV